MSEPTQGWYDPEEDGPFQGMLGGAVSRIRRRREGRVQEYGPAWLEPTAPRTWRWDFDYLTPIFDALNALARHELEGLMLFAPPRHLKTETTTVRFPVYWLESWPDQRVIVGMHTQTLANKVSRKSRRIARERLRIDPEREAVEGWDTIEGGGYRAIGVGGAIAGEGANLFCIDDPIRSRMEAESQSYRDKVWDWWTDDLFTRREPGAVMLLTMARWHEDDMAGRILNSTDAKRWHVLSFPATAEVNDSLGRAPGEALCPERFDEVALARIREVEGSYGFSGLYQQRPAPAEGGIFKRTWWQFWEPVDEQLGPVYVRDADGGRAERLPIKLPDQFTETLQSWDMSFKGSATSDDVAGQVWARQKARAFLVDREFGKKDFPKTIAAVRALTRKHPHAIRKLVEDAANGPAVIAMLRGEVPGLIGVRVDGDKVARAHAVTGLVEAGNVYLPHPALCPWVWDVIEAFATFPNSANDHDVDAGVQALRKLFPLGIVQDEDYLPARIHA